MMLLSDISTKGYDSFENAGYRVPKYNRKKMVTKTMESPFWIHFGAGNIFRAFQANVIEQLLNKGVLDRGLIVAEGYDYEIIDKIYHPYDNHSILVTLKTDGTVEKSVIGSVAESLVLDSENLSAFSRLQEVFRSDSLQIASFTITEKGYQLCQPNGSYRKDVMADIISGPDHTISYMGKVVSLLHTRYLAGKKPIALVSMDNCSHNGSKLFDAVFTYASEWLKRGLVDSGFVTYIKNPDSVSFPWTMIDKITPRPDSSIEAMLQTDGITDSHAIITGKNTYIAPYVNAEECEYLVIEDHFPNKRPPLEQGGFLFTDREPVDKVEKMKVCTCLNPLHTALAIFGCLLDYHLISEELNNETLRKLIEGIGYREGLPVVVNPGIISPKDFLDTVLNVRLPNPFMPDTPQRIATDTSQKLAIRFGETIKAYEASKELHTYDLTLIPLVFAGWLRYLMGIDDNGNPFTLSPDPMLSLVQPYFSDIHLGDIIDVETLLAPLLSNATIWGVNLYHVGLADTVCTFFSEMIKSPGAVLNTLKKYI